MDPNRQVCGSRVGLSRYRRCCPQNPGIDVALARVGNQMSISACGVFPFFAQSIDLPSFSTVERGDAVSISTSMASSALGILPSLKFSSIYHNNHKASNNSELKVSITTRNLNRPRFLCLAASNPTDKEMEKEANKKEKVSLPNSLQVQALVSEICSTSIAEFELKIHGFRLFIVRDISGNSKPSLPVAVPDVPFRKSTAESLDSNGAATSTALAISSPELPLGSIPRLVEKVADEGLIVLKSPKVGYFRRSRTIKGKRAPPACKEKQTVKDGQVVCFVEQLGGEIPVESEVAGEITKILKEDGEPVGYGDPLIVILPSFPGIKKLQ